MSGSSGTLTFQIWCMSRLFRLLLPFCANTSVWPSDVVEQNCKTSLTKGRTDKKEKYFRRQETRNMSTLMLFFCYLGSQLSCYSVTKDEGWRDRGWHDSTSMLLSCSNGNTPENSMFRKYTLYLVSLRSHCCCCCCCLAIKFWQTWWMSLFKVKLGWEFRINLLSSRSSWQHGKLRTTVVFVLAILLGLFQCV